MTPLMHLNWLSGRYRPTTGRRFWIGTRRARLHGGGWYVTLAAGVFGRGAYVGAVRHHNGSVR